MHHCLECGSEIPSGKRFCGDCGTGTGQVADETQTSLSGSSTPDSRSPFDQARFIPGTVLAGRYRIVGLLGRGGMGEVYRADDLKLGQTVALKFLPQEMAQDPGRLERFLNEVRTALKVTHPNVCRVYDIGEVDPSTSSGQVRSGQRQHFISMEYVDGEDLASLLRRIERLPESKAVQIARQICAGLAAAHEQGILHRDLKPANVMIDGRGRAKITDFGLAALAESLEGKDVRSGTPGYMAPEQLAGKEVTVRSDVYALGLVLFELCTGRRAFEGDSAAEVTRNQQESTPTDPSSFVKDLDPAVERVILRCMERDPENRPASALAVAASLPGGDPLAAALAEGETPSPEMVAAAGPQGSLRPGVATTCLLVALVGLLVAMWSGGNIWLENRLSWVKSFDALRDDARELVGTLGYDGSIGDSSARFQLRMVNYLYRIRGGEEDVANNLSKPGRETLRLFYRQSPGDLVPTGLSGNVSLNDPTPATGDIALEVDLQGRLRYLRVTPSRLYRATEADPEPDWRALFEAAGADIDRFEQVEPTIQPPVFADTRAAWTGSLSESDDLPVRIEAAVLHGKPVYFRTIEPSDRELWSAEESPTTDFPVALSITILVLALTFILFLIVGAVVLAVRSLRLGRGDRKGAARVALTVFALRMLQWVLAGHHVPGLGEIVTATIALCGAVTLGAMAWLLYLALEPYVRRFWPEAMVSWTRLLAGKIRDPLVGRDVLVGFTALGASSLIFSLALWMGESAGLIVPIPRETIMGALKGGRFALGALAGAPLLSLTMTSVLMLGFLLLRIVVRKTWIAVVLLCTLWGTFQGLTWTVFVPPDKLLFGLLFGVGQVVLVAVVVAILLARFGFLALISHFLLSGVLASYPQSLKPSLPYFTTSLIGPFVVATIGILAYRIASASHRTRSQ